MTEQEIISGNVDIANKLTKPLVREMFFKNLMDVEFELMDASDFRFDIDWNWLMKVVVWIEEHGGDENEFDIFGNCVQAGEKEFVGKTKIEATWKAVVDWCRTA